MVESIQVLFILTCVSFVRGVNVYFQEADINSNGSKVYVQVSKDQQNLVPLTISIQPLTISQYQDLPGAATCSDLSNLNHAEAEDFNATIQSVSVPEFTSDVTYEFVVDILQHSGIGEEKVFVILLNVTGGETTSARGCTRVHFPLDNQYLRWTHNGKETVSNRLEFSYYENSGSQVVLRVERLVTDTVATNISVTYMESRDTADQDITIAATYTIPPSESYVDIGITFIDNSNIDNDRTLSAITLTPQVPQGVPSSNNDVQPRRVSITILDNDVVNYEFLNSSHTITITEGDNVTVTYGLNPKVELDPFFFQVVTLRTANGTAQDGLDFHGVFSKQFVSYEVFNDVITTVHRFGPQPTRVFTILLEPFGQPNNKTQIHGIITIIILDTSKPPLAPSISSFGFSKEDSNELRATWSQEISELRPLDNFLVIVKTCTKLPCEIDQTSPKDDEKRYNLFNDTRELLHLVDSKNDLFEILVCAENILGQNCTSSSTQTYATKAPLIVVTEHSPDQDFIVPVVIVCVLGVLLCCLLPLILLIIYCCCKKYIETSYYPRKMEGEQKNYTSSSDSLSYTDEVRYGELKYVL